VWTPTLIHVASYMVVMVPLCAWLALGLGMGVWGVYVGITVASVLAGTGQILALEWITRGHGGRPGPRAGEVSFGAAPH
jgi:MATE family multidrug resistance protein